MRSYTHETKKHAQEDENDEDTPDCQEIIIKRTHVYSYAVCISILALKSLCHNKAFVDPNTLCNNPTNGLIRLNADTEVGGNTLPSENCRQMIGKS